jgi:hypothetical protein
VTTKTTAARRQKSRQGGYADRSGPFRSKPRRPPSITINPGGRSAPREPATAEQRAALERRRRVEQHAEDADLAEATGEIWDESG